MYQALFQRRQHLGTRLLNLLLMSLSIYWMMPHYTRSKLGIVITGCIKWLASHWCQRKLPGTTGKTHGEGKHTKLSCFTRCCFVLAFLIWKSVSCRLFDLLHYTHLPSPSYTLVLQLHETLEYICVSTQSSYMLTLDYLLCNLLFHLLNKHMIISLLHLPCVLCWGFVL